MMRWRASGRGRRRRPLRLLAVAAFHNATRDLPGWLANVTPHVDGVVAVDDGSTDGSAELLAGHPCVLEVVRRPARDPHVWEDGRNHRLAIEAASAHDPDWLVAIDADERVEREFRRRAEAVIAAAPQVRAFAVRLHELWDGPDTYRVDGVWGDKWRARLFTPSPSGRYDERTLHGHWAPLDTMTDGRFPKADLLVYHLHMIRAEDRAARRARYEALDPDRRWQAIGYEYLTDETGLCLERLPAGREYEAGPSAPPIRSGPDRAPTGGNGCRDGC